MSSSIPGCLLETSVTWQDVESELQKSLGTTAKFGEKRKVTNFGHMKGFMSRIALIEPNWTPNDKEQELPEKFIVKISSALGVKDLFDVIDFLKDDSKSDSESDAEANGIEEMIKLYHNREVETYKIISREKNPMLRTTKIYASKPFTLGNPSGGFLVCEFIPNVHSIPIFGTIPYHELEAVIESVGAFSALSETMKEEEKKAMAGEGHLEEVIRTFFPDNSFPKIRNLLLEALGEGFKEKIEGVMKIVDLVASPGGMLKNYSKMSEFLGCSPVLLHTDLWSANMLFTKDNAQLTFKALIDFQDTSFGSPGLDMASLAVCCMSAEDRRTHRLSLLQLYFHSFNANLKECEIPYTLQQLYDSYDLVLVPLTLQILPVMWCLAKNAGSEEALSQAKEKMTGLIEDLLEVHEKNLERFPTFFEA